MSLDELGRHTSWDGVRAVVIDIGVSGFAAADNLKRVRRAPAAEPDWTLTPGLDTMTDFVEIKTVWHPMGV